MESEIVLITPELANKFLLKNTGNRSLNKKHLSFLLSQMNSGKWKSTGDTIKFSNTNRLLDGQHRLHAIVKCNKSFEMVVIKNLKDEVFNVVDTGKVRSSADVVSVAGYANPFLLSSSTKLIILLSTGIFNGYHSSPKEANITNSDVLKFIDTNKNLLDSASFANSIYSKNRFLKPSVVCALYYLFSKINNIKAEEFFMRFATGIDMKALDPILKLREILMQDSIKKTRYSSKNKIALTILSWNAFIKNKEIKQFRLTDEFPKIIGG